LFIHSGIRAVKGRERERESKRNWKTQENDDGWSEFDERRRRQ